MSWSYSTALTATKDQVRLLVGDNVSGRTVTLADEEISWAVTNEMNVYGAAARAAEMLAAAFLSKADTRLGRSLMLQYTKQAEQYEALAKKLRRKATGINVPWAGGMNVADKDAYEDNTLLVQPTFTRTMQENPRVGGYTSDTADAQTDTDTV